MKRYDEVNLLINIPGLPKTIHCMILHEHENGNYEIEIKDYAYKLISVITVKPDQIELIHV